MEVIDILPITIAFNADFKLFKEKFDSVIKEVLKIQTIRIYEYHYGLQNKRLHSLMLCDLKRWIEFKKLHNHLNNLVYNGRIKTNYIYWVSELHPIIYNAYNWKRSDILNTKFPKKDDETYDEYEKRKSNFQHLIHKADQGHPLTGPYYKDGEKLIWIKLRVVSHTLNYEYVKPYNYDATGLKHYNPTTKKTSNKHLIAVKYYGSVNYQGRKCGWEFGGITAHSIERFCIQNGFVKEKKKKYQYGDYAEWMLKTLQ